MSRLKIALVKGNNRYQNVAQSLSLLEKDFTQKIKGKKNLIVKVNFVSPNSQSAATHVEAVRALLDFLKPHSSLSVEIVETGPNAQKGFSNFGYRRLVNDYNVKLNDLADSQLEEVLLYNINLNKRIKAKVYRQTLESDFLISVTPAKTHDVGMVTLSLKNVAVGLMKNSPLIHQGYQAFNKNLFLLIQKRVPDLAIIDATVGIEGNGPLFGQPKKAGWVLSSFNSIQADIVAAKLMGFNPREVGYLYYCLQEGLATDDFGKITILGEKPKNCQTKFLPHKFYQKQLKWNSPPSLKERMIVLLIEKIYAPFKQTRLGQKISSSPPMGLIKRAFGFQ